MSTNCPLVSIIIPCYNAVHFVGEAIESALAQTYRPIEVITIDDGSTDGTLQVVKRYEDRVQIETGPQRGPGAARNSGVRHARGEFIQFLDADDILLPKKIQICVRANIQTGDICFSRKEFFNDPSVPIRRRIVDKVLRRHRTFEPVWRYDNQFISILRTKNQTAGPLHRASALHSAGLFREDIRNLEDVELHFRLALHGFRFRPIDQPLFRVRNHSFGRLRFARGGATDAVKGNIAILRQAADMGVLTTDLRDLLASRLSNAALRAYFAGDYRAGDEANRLVREIGQVPEPTRSRAANAIINLFGPKRTAQLARIGLRW